MSDPRLPFGTRLGFAWACWFRVLFDPEFAARAWAVREAAPVLPEPPRTAKLPREKGSPKAAAPKPEPKAEPTPKAEVASPSEVDLTPALQLLALLQREGRFVDFVQQDLGAHDDAAIGAAARVVHEGCRRAVRAHASIVPVRSEEEGARVKLEAGFDAALVKLEGDVKGKGPFEGVLRHRGWRAESLKLPAAVKGHDARVLCPAEVEL